MNASSTSDLQVEFVTVHDLNRQLVAKAAELEDALEEFKIALTFFTVADLASRKAQAFAHIKAKAEHPKASVQLLLAYVETDPECAPLIEAAEMAANQKVIAKRALDAKEAQLSALQSMASAVREEMRLAR